MPACKVQAKPCQSLFKVFACMRKRKQWPGLRRTPQPGLPVSARPGKGCCTEHGHLRPCPKACFAKAASAVLQMLGRQTARFSVFVSVFRALCLAATAFARQRARREDLEQAPRLPPRAKRNGTSTRSQAQGACLCQPVFALGCMQRRAAGRRPGWLGRSSCLEKSAWR